MDFLNWDTPGSESKDGNPLLQGGQDSIDGLNYNPNNMASSSSMKGNSNNNNNNNNNSSNPYNSQRSNSNGTPGSYSNVGPSPGSGSYGGNTPDYTRVKDEAASPGIRASLSRALSNNNNGGNNLANTVNFPIPEEDEDDDDELEGDEHNPYAYEANAALSSSVASGRGSASGPSSMNNSRRNTATSPGGSTNSPVDRKRRDNINDKIQELLALIPRPFFDESKDKSSGTKDGKPNKGQILSKSVEYISHLQSQIDERNRKEVELSIKLRNLEIANSIPVEKRMNLLHTSAEIGLAKIGVGPLAEQQEDDEDQQQTQEAGDDNNFDASNSGSNVDTPNR